MQLYNFQKQILADTETKNRVAYYMEMGTGKTFVGSEKLTNLCTATNLVICQKSKIKDWIKHFKEWYNLDRFIFNLTNKKEYDKFINNPIGIGFINYELVFRRKDLLKLKNFTLMLDESSMIQNDEAKRTKFILNLKADNVILLSGTPVNGKYENLYSQIKLLGWDIPKKLFYNQYIITKPLEVATGVIINQVIGYKNVNRLKSKLAEHGAVFLTSEQAKLDLPESTDITMNFDCTPEYRKFMKTGYVRVQNKEYTADTHLNRLLYSRMLCTHHNKMKLQAFRDLLQSTEDRIIVFYNFYDELYALEDICIELNRPTSIVNGKSKDLACFEDYENSVTFIQYQSGAMGLNLQKCNKTIYFSLPLSSEQFEQSKARTNRIGQDRPVFYYYLICKNSVEEKILDTLKMRKDYTDRLFEQDFRQKEVNL